MERDERLDLAKRLAEKHLRIDEDVQEVYLVEEPKDGEGGTYAPIRLLEIVVGTPKVGLEPLGFPASADRGNMPLVIIEISPMEFQQMGGLHMTFGERNWRVTERLAKRQAAA